LAKVRHRGISWTPAMPSPIDSSSIPCVAFDRTMSCCRKKDRTTWPDCRLSACGSSTRSMVRRNSVKVTATTGPYILHCGIAPQEQTENSLPRRSRTPAVAAAVASQLGYDGVRLGSAGAKTMAVVLGHVDIYLHAGGQYQWDSAAPIAVARAAGLHTSRIDGTPLLYNVRDTWLPDLLVCQPHLANDILQAVRNFTSL
jgi:hypothetical protein